jgi:hypothetical protein
MLRENRRIVSLTPPLNLLNVLANPLASLIIASNMKELFTLVLLAARSKNLVPGLMRYCDS